MNPKLRVLVLTHVFPRWPEDPVGLFVAQLAQAVLASGVESFVVAPSGPGLSPEGSFDTIPVRRYRYAGADHETLAYTGTLSDQVRHSWSGRAAFAGMLANGLRVAIAEGRRRRVDLVHAHWWVPGGVVGVLASRVLGVPLVITSHGSDVRLAQGAAARWLLRRVARSASAMTAVSTWLADAASAATGREVVVGPMPVKADAFPPGPAERPMRLLFVGKLSEQKGLHYLLEALARCRTKPVLEVVGAGRVADSALRERAAALGLADRILWSPILSQPELAERYRAAAALVVPAIDEGLGLTAIEAALSETPVIAFASGGLPDCVRDGESGLLVPPRDIDGLSRAIDLLMGDPARARHMGRAGRGIMLERFGERPVADRYVAIYHKVLDGTNRNT